MITISKLLNFDNFKSLEYDKILIDGNTIFFKKGEAQDTLKFDSSDNRIYFNNKKIYYNCNNCVSCTTCVNCQDANCNNSCNSCQTCNNCYNTCTSKCQTCTSCVGCTSCDGCTSGTSVVCNSGYNPSGCVSYCAGGVCGPVCLKNA